MFKRDLNQVLGFLMFIIGSSIFSVAAFMNVSSGAVPAAAVLILILSVAVYFPSMLEDGSSSLSTMRVVVLLVTSVFVVVTVKIGWTITNFSDFKIDNSWIYVLGLVFGAKVTQSFAELLPSRTGKKGTNTEANTQSNGDERAAVDPSIAQNDRNILAGESGYYEV